MREKNKTLLKNIGIFTIGSFGSKILSFLLVPLYTSVLSTDEYGIVDIMLTTVSLLIPIITLSIQDAVLRFSLDKEYSQIDVISSTMRLFYKGLIFLVLIDLVLFKFHLLGEYEIVYVFFLINYVLSFINSTLTIHLKGKNNTKSIVVSGILCTFFTCIFNIMFLLVFKLGMNGYIFAYSLGLLVSVLYQLFIGKTYLDLKLIKFKNVSPAMIQYSLPLIPNSLAWWINNASDRYILAFFRGVSDNGIYSVSYKVPTILSTIQTVFYNAWSISAISEFDNKDEDGFFSKNYENYNCISIMACTVMLCLNIPIAKLLYSNEFYIAWKSVPFLIVGTLFNGLSLFEGCLYAAAKQTKLVSITTVIGAIVNTICNFIFIYLWGIVGAAFSTMLGYIVTWSLRTFFMKRIINLKVKFNIHILSYIIILLQTILATLGELYIAQVFLAIIIIIINANTLMPFVKKIVKVKEK